jgi:hypothetical protein
MNKVPLRQVNALLHTARTLMEAAEGKRGTPRKRLKNIGLSSITSWRTCTRHPGFAVRVGGTFRIPETHVRRVERGELPAAIAADAGAE